jgi:hypothetical protein
MGKKQKSMMQESNRAVSDLSEEWANVHEVCR